MPYELQGKLESPGSSCSRSRVGKKQSLFLVVVFLSLKMNGHVGLLVFDALLFQLLIVVVVVVPGTPLNPLAVVVLVAAARDNNA